MPILTKSQLEDMELCMIENTADCYNCSCSSIGDCQMALVQTAVALINEVEALKK